MNKRSFFRSLLGAVASLALAQRIGKEPVKSLSAGIREWDTHVHYDSDTGFVFKTTKNYLNGELMSVFHECRNPHTGEHAETFVTL